MWWVAQILAIMGITAVHTFNRWAGINGASFLVKWGINAGAQCFIAPLFILSYALAPSMFQPWFLGTISIGLFGFLVSIFFFGETLTVIQIVGAILGLISAVLLII